MSGLWNDLPLGMTDLGLLVLTPFGEVDWPTLWGKDSPWGSRRSPPVGEDSPGGERLPPCGGYDNLPRWGETPSCETRDSCWLLNPHRLTTMVNPLTRVYT